MKKSLEPINELIISKLEDIRKELECANNAKDFTRTKAISMLDDCKRIVEEYFADDGK